MQRILSIAFALAVTVIGMNEAHAAKPRNNPGLPKVDFQMGQITPVGQGLAIPVKNGGFETSPRNSVTVAIYDLRSRRLLMTKSLDLQVLQPNQTRRLIIVPPNPGQAILVRAIVDPSNRVAETNERNNSTASQH